MAPGSPLANALLNQRYELLGVIGSGQYGTAWQARSRSNGHIVCLKRIPLNSKDDHKGALQEAQLLSRLDHPNIISYIESFLDSEGALCIATTYCEDGDLFTRIRSRRAEGQYFTEAEVMDTFIQVASALMYIHSRKILHRDLKTQNIFLKSDGIVMLGDFGICKVLEKTDAFATTVTGTPYYMAPEVCTNQPYTFKSDIWSLGCVLYELCTLTHAFAADSLLSLVYQIVRGSYPPLPAELFSKDMNDLVQQLLTREPAERPSLQQVLASPYVQSHMQRFNAEERRRIVSKQTSLTRRPAAPGVTVPAAGQYQDPHDATVPAGLTPKQRIALRKEEERRRREFELQVASVNVSKERQEVAKRKQHQLASNSLAGILPAPMQAQQGSADLSAGAGRPGSPEQQTPAGAPHSPSRFAVQNHARPASAAAAYGTLGSTKVGNSPEKVYPFSTHNSHATGLPSSRSVISTTRSPNSLSPDRDGQEGRGQPGRLAAAAAPATSNSSSPNRSAFQAYEDMPVGQSGTKKASPGLFQCNEDDDSVNLATMPQQTSTIAAVGATTRPGQQDLCELSMDSDSVLLGSVVQQRPFTAPVEPGMVRPALNTQWLQQPFPAQPQQGSKAQSGSGAQVPAQKLAALPKATAAAVAGIHRATSEPSSALAAAAVAAARPSGFKFGLDTAERKALSCNGGSAAAPAAGSAGGIHRSALGLVNGAVVRFGARSDSEPPSVFDYVLAGLSSDDSVNFAAQQQHTEPQASQQHTTQQQRGQLGSTGQDRYSKSASAAAAATAAGSTDGQAAAVGGEADSADEVSEDYENDFEDYNQDEASASDSDSLMAEVEQRRRIMQTIAELSKSFSSVSVSSGSSSGSPSSPAAAALQPKSSISTPSSRAAVGSPQQQPAAEKPLSPDIAACQTVLGEQYQAVYEYLLKVHKGAAAGGGGVRGDEIKENIVNMVGRDKAKQEACFSLEQFVFRAVLAGR